MQIFYCDNCGMRIPQAQIDNGQAARLGDEKLACPACSKHVAPRPAARPQAKSSGIRLDAIQPVKNPASSGTLVPYRRPTRESGAAHDRHDRYGGHGHGAKGADSSSSAKLYAGVGIGFFVVLLGVIFASGGNKKVETDRREAADIPRAKTTDAPDPAQAQAKGPQLLTPPPRTTPDPRHETRTVPEPMPGPLVPDPQGNAEPDREDLAADAFDALKKFEGLAADDKDGRKRMLASFLETYGDTMAGARARVLQQNLESGVSDDDAEDAPEPVEAPSSKEPPTNHVTETVEEDGTRVAVLTPPWAGSSGTEAPDGAMKTSSSYLNVGSADMQTVTFLHFPGFPVPPRAKILEAHIQFTAKYPMKLSSSAPPAMTIEAEAADNSEKPSEMKIAGRTRTQAQVSWPVPAWITVGERSDKHRTPDLSALVQEVVNRRGWQANNAILFLFSKGIRHSAYPRDLKVPARSPTLTVRYREAGAGAPAPVEPATASDPAQPAVTGDAGLLQVLAVLAPELRKGEFDDAAERVDVLLKDPNFAGAAEALAREKRDLAAVLALREATIASLNEGGKAVKLNKGKLDLDGKTVRGTDHTKVTVRITGGLEMVVYAREFSAAEIARYAPQPRTADERRARAYLHLATGDVAQARAVLVEAGKNGDPGLQPYLDRLDLAALDANSLKAKAAWLSVEKHVTNGQFADANAALKAFQAAYGDTAFAKDMAATIKARAREIDKVINPYLPGLKGEYFKSATLKAEEKLKERIDATIDFHWGNDAPMSGVPQNFAIRWTGLLKVPKKGTYTLAVSVDDGARLYVDGNLAIDRWSSSPEKKHEASVELDEGYHKLKLEFFDGSSTAVCVFLWSLKDGFAEQVVPPEALWRRDETQPSAAAPGADPAAGAAANELKPATLAPGEGIFLGDIKPKSFGIGGNKYAADGTLGHSSAKISVGGVESPHGICTQPFENGEGRVTYELDRPYRQFIGHVAINDTGNPKTPIPFTIELDGNVAWTSRPLQAKSEYQAFAVDVTNAKTLTLRTACKGSNFGAHAVWFEPRLLLQPLDGAGAGNPPGQVFLSDLEEQNAKVTDGWTFGKKGRLGHSYYKNKVITADGVPSPNGLSMSPPDAGKSTVTYVADGKYGVFESRVAICDTSRDKANSTATFKVYGDGRLLWQSNPIQKTKVIEDCKVSVSGIAKLTLEVECPGSAQHVHAVWLEPRLLDQHVEASPNPAASNPAPASEPAQVYLADLPEQDVSVVANWKFGKKGQTGAPAGDNNAKILVAGFESPNGLSLHPPSNGKSHVAYKLDKKFRTFSTRVGLSDSSANKAATPVIFKVLGDGKPLWQSKSIQKLNSYDGCTLNVVGIEKLELEVECRGDASRCHAVWIEPLLNR